MNRNCSEKTEPKKQNAYASFEWRKKQPTGRKIHPAMAVTKRSMPSRNDVLISGPEPILDGSTSCQTSRGNKVRFRHIANYFSRLAEYLLSGLKRTLFH